MQTGTASLYFALATRSRQLGRVLVRAGADVRLRRLARGPLGRCARALLALAAGREPENDETDHDPSTHGTSLARVVGAVEASSARPARRVTSVTNLRSAGRAARGFRSGILRAMWGRLATRAACGAALAVRARPCAALPWPSGPTRPERAGSGRRATTTCAERCTCTRARRTTARGTSASSSTPRTAPGLAFVALTEHPRRARFRPARGVVEGVILIPGWELGAAGASILALGIEHRRGLPREPKALVEAIHARGGAAFVGHLELSRPREARALRRGRTRTGSRS